MKHLDKYIGMTVIKTILLVLFAMIGLQIFIGIVSELGDVGKGDYILSDAFIVVLLELPHRIYTLFPMLALLGGVIGLGYLASHSELIVFQASGVSKARIAIAVLKAALVMVIVVTFLGEVVAPPTEHFARTKKAVAKSAGKTLKTKQGTWVRDGNDFINIQALLPGDRLEGISRYRFDDNHKLTVTSFAKFAKYENEQWVMQDVAESYFSNAKVSAKHIEEQTWDMKIQPDLLGISVDEPDEMSMAKLEKYIHYLKENSLQSGEYDLAFWQRIFQPLATLVMVLVALPFVFGALRSITMGTRILMGFIMGFSFHILNQFFGPMSLVMQVPPVLGAFIPVFLFSLFGVFLFWRVGRV